MGKTKKRDAADLLREAIGNADQQDVAVKLECAASTLSRILKRHVRPSYPLRKRIAKMWPACPPWPGIDVDAWDKVRTADPRRRGK